MYYQYSLFPSLFVSLSLNTIRQAEHTILYSNVIYEKSHLDSMYEYLLEYNYNKFLETHCSYLKHVCIIFSLNVCFFILNLHLLFPRFLPIWQKWLKANFGHTDQTCFMIFHHKINFKILYPTDNLLVSEK